MRNIVGNELIYKGYNFIVSDVPRAIDIAKGAVVAGVIVYAVPTIKSIFDYAVVHSTVSLLSMLKIDANEVMESIKSTLDFMIYCPVMYNFTSTVSISLVMIGLLFITDKSRPMSSFEYKLFGFVSAFGLYSLKTLLNTMIEVGKADLEKAPAFGILLCLLIFCDFSSILFSALLIRVPLDSEKSFLFIMFTMAFLFFIALNIKAMSFVLSDHAKCKKYF